MLKMPAFMTDAELIALHEARGGAPDDRVVEVVVEEMKLRGLERPQGTGSRRGPQPATVAR